MTILYHSFTTILGAMRVGVSEYGVRSLQFEADVQEHVPLDTPSIRPDQRLLVKEIESKVQAFLKSPRTSLSSTLDLSGTSFQRDVWSFLQTIPPGTVCSYTAVAESIGRPQAVRAVASACAGNTIALIIPCHRVIRADRSLGGYRWGLERKSALLERESADAGSDSPPLKHHAQEGETKTSECGVIL